MIVRACQNHDVDTRTFTASVVTAAPADVVYSMLTDVSRMGEWSPVCTGGWWDEGAGPEVGSWFTGRNETPGRTWETRSEVVEAEPGRAFAFVVGGKWTRWSYRLDPEAGGTRLTETWEFLPEGVARFHERYGDRADDQIAQRTEAARTGIPETLAAIKRTAEELRP
jgi:hypothetical protein